MPSIPKLNNIAQSIISGERPLDEAAANELIQSAVSDGRIHKDEELKLLEQVEASAPKGSVFGRELLKEFIEGGENRIRSKHSKQKTSSYPATRFYNTWMRSFNPFLPTYEVPKPSYASTEKGGPGNYTRDLATQTEQNAVRNLTNERVLEDLVMKFEGASTKQFGWTRTAHVPNDDVYQVYLNEVKGQPINEYNPLEAVENYLKANYTEK
ncbi:MAG TPA: hypothetical protein DCE42_17805 [Myxococcales bacterium]|nr:hypothetical protein [Deltaproteobacteria bacterium]HAA56624.1 hypothetical protein [Myxococcales bacterium]|tara:strand:- start:2596 stop:3228 length:633 start_codon:yes stop_codon:yes gene_type:complete